ncbi:hypothetical protein [Micromonospora echinofusca]|uniref:Clumping factor A n=1 Tax=Micromonospora echinofusca TaxID=47858 RepID=A0ABS3VR06_MICEH|nr:hypothetical protein [Micromonospora echinofusca]MBO4206965.1 hypothetical protein [Micromonospora echinofusca]
MIVASLLLILVAVVLLVLGLANGSSLLLITSIAASLLAAVALVVGARQAAATREAGGTPPGRPAGRPGQRGRTPAGGDASRYAGSPVGIPTQAVRTTDDSGRTGWRQPPGPSASAPEPGTPDRGGSDERWVTTADGPTGPAADLPADDLLDDEPPAQIVGEADATRVARLATPVLVVDGRPRYHLTICPHLVGRRTESLPVSEAVELGFTPCAQCAPDTALLADVRPV